MPKLVYSYIPITRIAKEIENVPSHRGFEERIKNTVKEVLCFHMFCKMSSNQCKSIKTKTTEREQNESILKTTSSWSTACSVVDLKNDILDCFKSLSQVPGV